MESVEILAQYRQAVADEMHASNEAGLAHARWIEQSSEREAAARRARELLMKLQDQVDQEAKNEQRQ